MKSYFKILVPVALGCTMAASCSKDFLKETSQSNYTPATITRFTGVPGVAGGVVQQL